MQGNNVGLTLGPILAGALASTYGWSSVPFAVAIITLAAIAGGFALERTRSGAQPVGNRA